MEQGEQVHPVSGVSRPGKARTTVKLQVWRLVNRYNGQIPPGFAPAPPAGIEASNPRQDAMDPSTKSSAAGTAPHRPRTTAAGCDTPHRVVLHLPDLTPRPGRKAAPPAAKAITNQPAAAGQAGKPSTAATTTIHQAHTGEQRVRPPSVPIVAAPVASSKPIPTKRRFLKPQPMLLLALIGITFGVLVGAIITRDRPPLAPIEPPPAWDGDAAHKSHGPVDGVSESHSSAEQSTETASNPPVNAESEPGGRGTQTQTVDDSAEQVPGVARLNGRIEVEPPVEANHEQPRPGLY